MQDSIYEVPSDLGKALSELRKAAKKKQADIAASLNVAQSRISRIEKGSVTPTDEEIKKYLLAIGTDEAQQYLAFLEPWQLLKRPSFRNPQRDELWKAEKSLRELEQLISQGAPDFVIRQAEMHNKKVRDEAEYLSSLEHSIAYIGSVGVGKTTAVCKLTELVIPQEKQFNRQSVLAVGAGRTTVCEVGIRCGEKFGIRIKPLFSDEINKLVEDFCTGKTNSKKDNQENQTEVVSEEIQRLLLNMAGLQKDNFADLASQFENADALRLKFLELLKISERTREEIWFDESYNQAAGLEWLQETSKLINYGRHREFSVPNRIDVIIPNNFFLSSPYELEILDTRGVDKDGTSIRRNLMDCLKNERTLTVLCSRFKDAPDREIYDLIENLTKTGSEKVLKERLIILVLPQSDEADNMTNHIGESVNSKDEAYNLKREEVQTKLNPLVKDIQAKDIPILFFNAKSEEDKPAKIAQALINKLDNIRAGHVHRLSSAVEAINSLIKSQKEQNAREAYTKVSESLKIFLQEHQNQPLRLSGVYEKLLAEMQKAHAGTLRASIRRYGTLEKLDVYFLIGNGSRSVAWNASLSAFYELKGVIKNRAGDPLVKEYADNFLQEILANWESWREQFLTYTEEIAEQIFRPRLITSDIWEECSDIKGAGFRDQVIKRLRDWFNHPEQKHLNYLLNKQIQEAWQAKVLAQLEKLTEDDKEG